MCEVCDRQTNKYHKIEAFPLLKCIDDMRRMGSWPFWSWFDVNRSIVQEDMHVTFRPQICYSSYSCPALCFH